MTLDELLESEAQLMELQESLTEQIESLQHELSVVEDALADTRFNLENYTDSEWAEEQQEYLQWLDEVNSEVE